MVGMSVLLGVAVIAAMLALLGFVLPRRARIAHEPTRLVVHRPVLARLLGDLRLFLAGALAAYFLALFLISREWVLVALAALVLLRMAWSVKRSRDRRQIVVDPTADRISEGNRIVGRASNLVAVQLGQQDPGSVLLVFRDLAADHGGTKDRGVMLGATDQADARTIGTAIANYLSVSIVETP
jgi:hypothetical protein